MKWQLTVNDASIIVSIDDGDPNEVFPIAYEGSEGAIAIAKGLLKYSHGAFGHLIGDATSAIDLDFAMHSPDLEVLSPTLIEGDRPDYNPNIPRGAVT